MENRAFSDHVRTLVESSQRKEGVQETPLIVISVGWESLGEDDGQRLRKGRMLKAAQDGLARYPGLFRMSVVMTDAELQRTRDMANVFGSGIRRIVSGEK